jgi:hypothetical protein
MDARMSAQFNLLDEQVVKVDFSSLLRTLVCMESSYPLFQGWAT